MRSDPNWRYDLDKGPSPRGNWAPGLDPGAEPLAGAGCLWVANPGAVAARAGKQQCVQGVSSWAAYAIQPTTGLAASPYGDRRFWPLPNCRLTAGILHSPWRCTAIGQVETIARIDLRVNRTRVLSFALSN